MVLPLIIKNTFFPFGKAAIVLTASTTGSASMLKILLLSIPNSFRCFRYLLQNQSKAKDNIEFIIIDY